jgi:hypothetical protein
MTVEHTCIVPRRYRLQNTFKPPTGVHRNSDYRSLERKGKDLDLSPNVTDVAFVHDTGFKSKGVLTKLPARLASSLSFASSVAGVGVCLPFAWPWGFGEKPF